MSLPTVHIDRWAFFNMLIAVTEVFKQESIGLLFGFYPTVKKNNFRVVNAFPLQHLSTRSVNRAEQSGKSDRLLTEMFSEFQGIAVKNIGGFHSHPEYGSFKVFRSLSDSDIQMMATLDSNLEIVVSVSTAKQHRSAWRYAHNGAVIGYHGGLRYVVDAYMLVGKPIRNNIRRIIIRSPSAIRSLQRLHRKQ
ncbi:MAG: hypothetical protein G01um101470_34 [Parcubacteria group bacterium Gr01-1014_70]|nr:MAG: hypothetical protein G01um101470_34 [Parcubacteria group bacterium Gr01-1014_70]